MTWKVVDNKGRKITDLTGSNPMLCQIFYWQTSTENGIVDTLHEVVKIDRVNNIIHTKEINE